MIMLPYVEDGVPIEVQTIERCQERDRHMQRVLLRASYFIVYTVTTVGYGDGALPDMSSHPSDHLIMSIIMMIGFLMYSLVSSNLHLLFKNAKLSTSIEMH
jgi:hypothetical protein